MDLTEFESVALKVLTETQLADAQKSNIEDRIKKWLNDSGFPLEMQAAQVFREQGYEVRQSVVLRDVQEDKPREVDMLASFPYELDRGITKINCVIECKSSKNPWLVFDAIDTLSNYSRLHAFAIMSDDARSALADILFKDKSRKSWKYFDSSSKCGYALRQPFVEKDTGYSAAMNVLKACRNVIEPSEKFSLPQINIAFPLIVVDSPIFECSQIDGELKVKSVTHSKFLFSSFIPNETGCRINIVHIDYLDSFAKHYINVSDSLREMLAPHEQEAMDGLKK